MLEGGPGVEAGEGKEYRAAMGQLLRWEGMQAFQKAGSFYKAARK